MRYVAAGVLLLLLAGCAGGGVAEVEARLGALVGTSEAELVRRVGVPARVHETGGRRFLAYVEYWPAMESPRIGAFGVRFGSAVPPSPERYCEATFAVDAGRVAGFTVRGTACGWSGWPAILP